MARSRLLSRRAEVQPPWEVVDHRQVAQIPADLGDSDIDIVFVAPRDVSKTYIFDSPAHTAAPPRPQAAPRRPSSQSSFRSYWSWPSYPTWRSRTRSSSSSMPPDPFHQAKELQPVDQKRRCSLRTIPLPSLRRNRSCSRRASCISTSSTASSKTTSSTASTASAASYMTIYELSGTDLTTPHGYHTFVKRISMEDALVFSREQLLRSAELKRAGGNVLLFEGWEITRLRRGNEERLQVRYFGRPARIVVSNMDDHSAEADVDSILKPQLRTLGRPPFMDMLQDYQ